MGKSIKEKARIAFEQELEVELLYSVNEEEKDWEAFMARLEVFAEKRKECRVAVDALCDELTEKGLIKPKNCDTEGRHLLCEATPDELGAENEALKRDNRLLVLQGELSKVRVSTLEAGKIERQQEQVIESEREQNDANTINGQSKQIREHLKTIATLEERLTVAEADQEIVTECGAVPESLRQKLGHAKLMEYEVRVEGEGYRISGKIKGIGRYEVGDDRELMDFESGTSVYLDSISHVEKVYMQSEREPDEPEDIAKQRWASIQGSSNVLITPQSDALMVPMRNATSQEMALMAAAPELADKARALVRGVGHSKRPGASIYPDGYNDLFDLLDKLSIKELQTPGTS